MTIGLIRIFVTTISNKKCISNIENYFKVKMFRRIIILGSLAIFFNKSVFAQYDNPRVLVVYPQTLIEQTLEKMRDHLRQISRIQEALGDGQLDIAASISEEYLGSNSTSSHLHESSVKYTPKDMQELGDLLHKNASKFAIEAKNASTTGDLRAPLAALSKTTQVCVACHAAFRLR
jgi:hypothetical protein